MKRIVLALLLVVLSPGCTPRKPAADTQLRSQALIDSGNVAFRAQDYEAAARRYASAAAIRSDDPAAYYGLGMALSRLGRDDEAREAYAKARALLGRKAPTLPQPH
jgi:Flp pilus assembly protein TadD